MIRPRYLHIGKGTPWVGLLGHPGRDGRDLARADLGASKPLLKYHQLLRLRNLTRL